MPISPSTLCILILWEVNTAIIMLIYILLFDAYGKKKVHVTGEIYIFRIIYIYLHVLRRDTGSVL